MRVTPGLTYCGDEYAIRQLVSILLDNAVKYAAPDTPIVFSLEKGRRGGTGYEHQAINQQIPGRRSEPAL